MNLCGSMRIRIRNTDFFPIKTKFSASMYFGFDPDPDTRIHDSE